MVAPHELKNKKFTNAVRGYSMAEVDDHIDFIIAQYTELYRQNADLEQRLMRMQEHISELEGKEASINSALVDAQKAAARTLSEANEQAETVLLATKTNCDKIMAQFRYDVEEERAKLNALRASVREFKAAMFETYRTHIEFLEAIAPGEIEDDTEDYTRKVVGLIKDDIMNAEPASEDDGVYEEPEAADKIGEVPEQTGDIMTEAAEETMPEPIPADTYAEEVQAVEAQFEEPAPEAPVQLEQPIQQAPQFEQPQPAQFEQPIQQFEEPIQQFEEPSAEEVQPEAPTYEDVHNIGYDEPAQPEPQYAQPVQQAPQYAEPVQAAQPAQQYQYSGMPVADDEEDVFEEDAFDDIPVQPVQTELPVNNSEEPVYEQNTQFAPPAAQYYGDEPTAEPETVPENIYSRQSRPVNRMQRPAAPQRPVPQRPQRPMQPMQNMQQPVQPRQAQQPQQPQQAQFAQPVNPRQAKSPLGEERTNAAPAQGRSRTNRASVKDAIRQLNQTFVTEDDDDDDDVMTQAPPSRNQANGRGFRK